MHLEFRNVNDAFVGLVSGFKTGRIETVTMPSRNGEVKMIPEPAIITFKSPTERVLFNLGRDCNPFFHLFESLWMLAGRNDVAPLAYYNSNISEYSDDGKTFNGAYGYRWRHALPREVGVYQEDGNGPPVMRSRSVDQLQIIIDHLKKKPESRRVVLQMWNVEDDLLKIDTSKDVCCNTNAYFSIRPLDYQITIGDVSGDNWPSAKDNYVLDMTVCNRSNDLIWGMLGANVVHFSILQEYLASCIGVNVGVYHQFTNNLHVYMSKWDPNTWLDGYGERDMHSPKLWSYRDVQNMVPLVHDPETFDKECKIFVNLLTPEQLNNLRPEPAAVAAEHQKGMKIDPISWKEPFLLHVAEPMCLAFHCHKARDYKLALEWVDKIKGDDWRIAATNWINKRRANWEAKQKGGDTVAHHSV